MTESDVARQNRWILGSIGLAVAAWGVYHAWGAYLLNHNPWRALMVVACVGSFLGLWALLLMVRKLRVAPPTDDKQEQSESL